MKHALSLVALAAVLLSAGCIAAVERKPAAAPEARFVILDEGRMKFDTHTGQAWRRDGDTWILMKDAEERKPSPANDASDAYGACSHMVSVAMPINDIRKTEDFRKLPRDQKLRIYRMYYQDTYLFREPKDSPRIAEFYAALREDLGIAKLP